MKLVYEILNGILLSISDNNSIKLCQIEARYIQWFQV